MSLQLESIERSSGATFAAVGDHQLPRCFGDPRDEWAAVRKGCGVLDARFRGLLRLTGGDRVTFLQGMVSNDVARLRDGQGTYASLLTQQGKVVSDMRIYVLPDELWLDVPVCRTVAVRESLERYIVADDAEFTPSEFEALIAIEGPLAARTLLGVTGQTVEELPEFAHRAVSFNGKPLRVVVTSHTGEIGFLFVGPPDVAGQLWEHCCAAGAQPVGMEALDTLRIEAGIPWYGPDMDESTLVGEVGLEHAISYQKGCYLGQEVVERVAARGHVNRKLVGLTCAGQLVPPPGTKLTREGKEVGGITSATWSPARTSVLALAYARRECSEPGAEMQAMLDGGGVAAQVVPLPFYSRSVS